MDVKQDIAKRIGAVRSLARRVDQTQKVLDVSRALLSPSRFDFFEVKEAVALMLGKMDKRATDMLPVLREIFACADVAPMIRRACLKASLQIAPDNAELVTPLWAVLNNPLEASFASLCRRTLRGLQKHLPEADQQNIALALRHHQQHQQTGLSPLELCVQNRLGYSRTLRSGKHPQALENFREALGYIGQHASTQPKPGKTDFLTLNALLVQGLYPLWAPQTQSWQVNWGGLVRGADPLVSLELPEKHPVKSKDVPPKFEAFFQWYDTHYDAMDPFELSARTFQRLIDLHPMYEACGRTTRLFTDWLLLGKGVYLPHHPEALERGMLISEAALEEALRRHSRKIENAPADDPVLMTLLGKNRA